MNLFQLALRNIWRRPSRSAVTVLAIGIGIAAMVALTSIAWGFEASWQRANDARGTDLIVTRLASENAMPSPFASAALERDLKTLPQVKQVVGLLSEMLSVSRNGPPTFVFGWAYGSYLWEHLRLTEGRWPASDDVTEVVIGAMAAEMMHKAPGERLEIEGREFLVTGIYESSAMVEDGAVLMTLTQMQLSTDKPGKVNVLNVKMDAAATAVDLDRFKQQVRQRMPGYVAITSGELVRQNAIVRISKAMSQVTMLIAGLVSALVVFNTMVMSINERTREIGLLLAVGWQRSVVARLVFCESMLLSVAGGMLGVALGLALVVGLEHLELMRGKIDAQFPVSFLLLCVAASALLGLAGGSYPAWRASRLHPSEALRQE